MQQILINSSFFIKNTSFATVPVMTVCMYISCFTPMFISFYYVLFLPWSVLCFVSSNLCFTCYLGFIPMTFACIQCMIPTDANVSVIKQ